ncbi:ScbR family autoregulator-binding transcription factor [Arthrobacter monumenti]
MAQQARAQITRKSIIDGAAKVFLDVGYAHTTMAQVAASAGVTKGALYFHFDSKQALARAVIDENLTATTAIGMRVLSGGYCALESLVRISAGVAELTENPLTRAAVRLTMENSKLVFGEEIPHEDWIKTCENLIQRAIAEGSIRPDIDASVLAGFLVSAHTGVDTVTGMVPAREDVLLRLEEMWKMVLPGIVPPEKQAEFLTLPGVIRQTEADLQP